MAGGGYQGDLLELQKVAFAWWKVNYEQTQIALSKLKAAAENRIDEKLQDTIDPLLFIRNLVRIKQYEQTKAFQAHPLDYKGELLELQNQIFGRWKNTVEYRRLLRGRRKKKKAAAGIPRKLDWWEWIAVSDEYLRPGSSEKIVVLGNGPGDPGFRSVEYKTESGQHRNRWDNQTREPYQSFEYNPNQKQLNKGIVASQVDQNNSSSGASASETSE